jgi:hypothetical protein
VCTDWDIALQRFEHLAERLADGGAMSAAEVVSEATKIARSVGPRFDQTCGHHGPTKQSPTR